MSDLKNRAINSVMWTTVITVVGLITSPLLLILKARYLSPAEYGVMSILNLFMAIITTIENTGLNKAIIQKDNITKNEKSSLLIFQLIFGVLLALLLTLFSTFFAEIFDMSSLEQLLPVMSLTIVISAPILILSSFLEKELRFKELSLIQIVRTLALLISTALFLIVFDIGLLGVVLGQIVSSIVGVILILFVTIKYTLFSFEFSFRFSNVIPFLKFGISVAGKESLTQITNRIDEMIIGYFFTADVLGYYYFAKNTIAQLRATVSGGLSKVLFPLLSKVKSNFNYLGKLYKKISTYLGVIAFPMFIGLVTTSHLFIPILFGEEWLVSNTFFVLIALASLPNFIISNLSNALLYSVNKPNLVLAIELIVNGVYIVFLSIVSWLSGSIYSIVGVYVLFLISKPIILQVATNIYLQTSFFEYISVFKLSFLNSIVMGIVLIITQYILISTLGNLTALLLSILIGMIIYFGLYLLLDKETVYEIKQLIFDN